MPADNALKDITLSTATRSACWGEVTGTDLAALPNAGPYWTSYVFAIKDRIGTYAQPFITGQTMVNTQQIPYIVAVY